MKTKTVIDYFGGVAALADALKCSPAAIYQWGDDVPRARVYEIHVKSEMGIPIDPEEPSAEKAA